MDSPTANDTIGVKDESKGPENPVDAPPPAPFRELSITDKLLTPFILCAMIIGVVLGEFAPKMREALDAAKFDTVSLPIAIGLIVMMWPALTKIRYESLPTILTTSRLWKHIGISVFLNWVVGPFVMLALAWATLPDLPTYRTGVILVGIARCIAMVVIWNDLARGDNEYCAILVVLNALMQMVLFSPFTVLFINVVGGHKQQELHVSYGTVAISVLIYLGIPLLGGIITRFTVIFLTRLLYTIIILFAYQGHHIVHNIGQVFRVFVPLILYFVIMWFSTFSLIYVLSRGEKEDERVYGYETAVVQAFTAASNNFELAIAVAIAVYGVNSEQALAATIGPLVEVPVLLSLVWMALYLKNKWNWKKTSGRAGATLADSSYKENAGVETKV